MSTNPEGTNRGSKAWLKHWTVGFLLLCASTVLALFKLLILTQILFLVAFVYLLLVVLGLTARVGPFAYIGKLYIKDAGITERPHKNRWPDA